MDKNKAYQDLFNKYKVAFPDKKPTELQNQVVAFWNHAKSQDNFETIIKTKLSELTSLVLKKKSGLLSYWSNVLTKDPAQAYAKNVPPSRSDTADSQLPSCSGNTNILPVLSNHRMPENTSTSSQHVLSASRDSHEAPAQTTLSRKISILKQEIALLKVRENANLLSEGEEKVLRNKKLELQKVERDLKTRQKNTERNRKYRQEKRRVLQGIICDNPQLMKKLKVHDQKGRPRIEENQPDILKIIVDLATHGSAADDRRRTESIRCIKSLDELTRALQMDYGFDISRSGVYLRLLPRRSNSIQGKKHITTVPVKLAKPQSDAHKNHIDAKFASATIYNLEELASMLGPTEVFFISQDDKARVPIGITAANKQSPLLMHVEYRVTLPDHDWVVAASHKLIPSVYAGIVIKKDGLGVREAVGYSGPTYIAIRSGKHSSSTAMSHVLDVERVLTLVEFDSLVKNAQGDVKPIAIFTVDGGPDENPRYAKVITGGIHHFTKCNLDALFVACNAPGRSAYNRVERRMAPLSKELAGLILPHEHYGSHLNNSGKTIDKEKEKQNFAFAGQTLAEIWSDVVIDGHRVMSEFISPEYSELKESDLEQRSQKWQDTHIRTSQYFLQIVKCRDTECCSPPRSSIFSVLPSRFLLPPIPISQSEIGLKVADENGKFPSLFVLETLRDTVKQTFNSFKDIAYDIACPSLKRDNNIQRKVCTKCGLYHASLNKLQSHQKCCGVLAPVKKIRPVRVAAKRQREILAIIKNYEDQEELEWFDEELIDTENIELPKMNEEKEEVVASLISIETHLKHPWENIAS